MRRGRSVTCDVLWCVSGWTDREVSAMNVPLSDGERWRESSGGGGWCDRRRIEGITGLWCG